jgi:hypothetical protein
VRADGYYEEIPLLLGLGNVITYGDSLVDTTYVKEDRDIELKVTDKDKLEKFLKEYVKNYKEGKLDDEINQYRQYSGLNFFSFKRSKEEVLNVFTKLKAEYDKDNFFIGSEKEFKKYFADKNVRVMEVILDMHFGKDIMYENGQVKLLKPLSKKIKTVAEYLDIILTEDGEFFVDDDKLKKVNIKEDTYEYALLAMLLKHKGEPFSRTDVYPLFRDIKKGKRGISFYKKYSSFNALPSKFKAKYKIISDMLQ